MRKNRIGKSSIFVSPLSLGCMSLPSNKSDASAIVHHALESGINHLDTADLYAFGANEKIVGDIIKQKRDDIILTTKVGNHFDAEKESWFWDPSKRYIETAIDASLRRLKTDYIDLYLLHGGTIEDPIDDTREACENLK